MFLLILSVKAGISYPELRRSKVVSAVALVPLSKRSSSPIQSCFSRVRAPLKKSFCERNKLRKNGLHQILGEIHRPPRQGMLVLTAWTKSALLVVSTEESLSRGMGGARRTEQNALLHRPENSEQLTLQLG